MPSSSTLIISIASIIILILTISFLIKNSSTLSAIYQNDDNTEQSNDNHHHHHHQKMMNQKRYYHPSAQQQLLLQNNNKSRSNTNNKKSRRIPLFSQPPIKLFHHHDDGDIDDHLMRRDHDEVSEYCFMTATPDDDPFSQIPPRYKYQVKVNLAQEIILSSSSSSSSSTSPQNSKNQNFSHFVYDYPASKDGGVNKLAMSSVMDISKKEVKKAYWPYPICPVKHRIRCVVDDDDVVVVSSEKSSEQQEKEDKKGNPSSTKNYKRKITKRKKSRALVIYMVTAAANPAQRHQENKNLNQFLRHGIVKANTPTALFDSVDYVFARVQLSSGSTNNDNNNSSSDTIIEDSTDRFWNCTYSTPTNAPIDYWAPADKSPPAHSRSQLNFLSHDKITQQNQADLRRSKIQAMFQDTSSSSGSNLKFILLPNSPCDICGHARVLELLGVYSSSSNINSTQQHEQEEEEYTQIFMLNSGVNGPFFESKDDDENEYLTQNFRPRQPRTTWLDFVMMAGRRKIENPRRYDLMMSENEKESNKKEKLLISVSSTISWQIALHHQTFFLSVPHELMMKSASIFSLFIKTCPTFKPISDQRLLERLVEQRNDGKKPIHARKPLQHKLKGRCIERGEVATGSAILKMNKNNNNDQRQHQRNRRTSSVLMMMYDLSKQFYVSDLEADSQKKQKMVNREFGGESASVNPASHFADPCRAIFVKMGGTVYASSRVPYDLLTACDTLEKGMEVQRERRRHRARNIDGDYMEFAPILTWQDVEEIFDKKRGNCDVLL